MKRLLTGDAKQRRRQATAFLKDLDTGRRTMGAATLKTIEDGN
jgi:hypothetical protein